MICPYCKYEIQESTGFCPQCGQTLPKESRDSAQTEKFWAENSANRQKDTELFQRVEKEIKEEKKKTVYTVIGLIVVFFLFIMFSGGIFFFI